MKNNAINTYLKELSKQLGCSGKEKKEILSSLKNRLSEFESEYPTALKYEDIVEQFGSPKEVANSFLGEFDKTQKNKALLHYNCLHINLCSFAYLFFPQNSTVALASEWIYYSSNLSWYGSSSWWAWCHNFSNLLTTKEIFKNVCIFFPLFNL